MWREGATMPTNDPNNGMRIGADEADHADRSVWRDGASMQTQNQ
jgi:hypothetical protein